MFGRLQMLISAILTILSLFSAQVLAQIYYPDCTESGYGWTFNSIGQSPCEVAAFLLSTCNGGSWALQPLPQGYAYSGPNSHGATCLCSTVQYSLLGACDACQGDTWFNWAYFSTNCTSGKVSASSFPNPVPAGTRVPHWALIDVTIEGTWDYNQSYTAGGLPEAPPGAIIDRGTWISTSSVVPSSTVTASTSSSTSSSQPAVTSTSSSSSSIGGSSKVGAIAGGVAGGLVAVSAAALVIFFFLWRRRPQLGQHTAAVYGGTPQPIMEQVQSPPPDDGAFVPPSLPTTPTTPIKLYDPNDPTTFPGYQGTVPAPAAGVYTDVPNMYTGSTVASTQTSRQLGYHGFPPV
ncbi:hypothetical protein BGW80DRAFT_286807 [Lactifluus volemus]|nr:hypothetical protein BGW80DRAFT_286807 [Lactifluus volemus]